MTPWWRSTLASALRLSWIAAGLAFSAACAGGLYLVLWLAWTGEEPLAGAIILGSVLLVAIALVVVSEFRSTRSPPVTEGVELHEEVHPGLWAAVRTVTAAVGVAPPQRLVLSSVPTEVGILATAGRLGWRRRVLALGVVPLCVLTPQEWTAALTQVLVVEHAPPRRDCRMVRGQRWILGLAEWIPQGRLLEPAHAQSLRAYVWLAGATVRRRQFEADVRSAELTSPQDARMAMLLISAAEVAWQRFWVWHVEPAMAILRRPIDVMAGFRAFLHAVDHEQLMRLQDPAYAISPYASLESRLAALAVNTQTPAEATPAEAMRGGASDLLGNQSVLTELELTWFDESGLTPLDWDGVAHAVASRGARQRAAWFLDAVSTPSCQEDLSSVIADLGRTGGRTLRERLFEPTRDEVDTAAAEPEVVELMTSVIGDLIAAALVDGAGARYVMNWAAPPTLTDAAGGPLDPWAAAADAAFDPIRAAALHDWCIDAGAMPDYRALPLGPGLGRTIMDSDPVVLSRACFFNNWRARYLFVLDTGVVLMRPRLWDNAIGGIAAFMGEPAQFMLNRWSQAPGSRLISARGAQYTDWADVRRIVFTTRSRRRFAVQIERVDGTARKVSGDQRSRFIGDMVTPLAHFLGDRFVQHPSSADEPGSQPHQRR